VTSTPSFAEDPVATVLALLDRAGRALSAAEVKSALRTGGADPGALDAAWPRLRAALRSDPHVVVEAGHRYRFCAQPPPVSAADALDQLAGGGLPAARRAHLAGLVRSALPEPGAGPRSVEVPLVRAIAELAIEVEELAANQASARALIHRVRAQVRRLGLEPIGQAGEQSTLDRRRHESISEPVDEGAPVVVLRPGYVWRTSDGELLIARAVVQDRS
jgi:hypothetical protein